ncbi:hypothetical protein RhiirC2_794015 [Rhizophagus irregularis]|uniref:Reverse transcriptase domain-containing protein n=1 Tax=Rhizophagus irregularis TaxID=588596 RepID=A0A2N1MEB0_9GLOM|nr:hypothetical protein RhiirC2_794015 [Rhizophagus irregularis]
MPRTCYFPKVDNDQDMTDNIEETLSHKVLGYLDDTTWLAENLTDLVSNLKIADSFYQLANIHINKEKTMILANKYAKKIINNNSVAPIDHIDLEFGSTIIKVPILAKYKAARILGVHLNPDDCHNTSTKKIFNMINYVIMLIRKKKLTHDHVIYVINRVIIPRIEYLSQHFMLSINQCNKINISLRSTIKQSIGLPKNIFNSVLHSNIYPNIVNFFDHQLKVQSSLLVAQANNPHTSNTLKFLFLLCQQKYCIKNKGIMFLDHIITKDHAFLEDYKDIKKHLVHKGGKIPHWYNFLQDNITINNQGRLAFNLNKPIIQNPSASRSAIPPEDSITLYHPKRSQQWVAAWAPHVSDIIYGKLLSTNHYPNCNPVSYMEHWIHNDTSATSLFTTPRSSPNIITCCLGCAQHFLITLKKREELYPRPNIHINNFQLLKYSHPHYRLLAFNDYLIQQGHNSTVNFRPIHPPSLTDQPNLNSLPNTTLIMKLFDDVKIVEDLQGISSTLSSFSHLEFFTDGSFEPTNSQVGHSMGYGWTTSNLTNVNITYNGSVKFFPSSTKAETITRQMTKNRQKKWLELHKLFANLYKLFTNSIG